MRKELHDMYSSLGISEQTAKFGEEILDSLKERF